MHDSRNAGNVVVQMEEDDRRTLLCAETLVSTLYRLSRGAVVPPDMTIFVVGGPMHSAVGRHNGTAPQLESTITSKQIPLHYVLYTIYHISYVVYTIYNIYNVLNIMYSQLQS